MYVLFYPFFILIFLLGIDMNEISNFCNGNCDSKNKPKSVSGFDPNNPPYAINNRNEHVRL